MADDLKAEGFSALSMKTVKNPNRFEVHDVRFTSPYKSKPPVWGRFVRQALPLSSVASCEEDKLCSIAPSPKFEGKSVLITGSSSGIGAAMCFEVARRGARRVVMLSRDSNGMERVRERIVKEVRRPVWATGVGGGGGETGEEAQAPPPRLQ